MNVKQTAFTELLVVSSIISVLSALLLVGVQSARESSRRISCQNNIRQVQFGIARFESAWNRLPPGTSGHKHAIPWEEFRNNPNSPVYWKKYQHTSFVAFVLPFLEQRPIYDAVDPIFFDLKRKVDNSKIQWFGVIPGFSSASKNFLEVVLCPSDDLRSNDHDFAGGSQPVLNPSANTFALSYVEYLNDAVELQVLAGTNYLGCGGAATGGIHPDPERNRHKGAMSSGEVVRFANVSDGLSNTIFLGETLGEIANGQRIFVQPWIVGGLARGQGNVPWKATPMIGESLLGTWYNSNGFGFGGKHASVNFVFGDGATRSLAYSIDWRTMYALCGIADGDSRTNVD
ncbi:MAG: DUF1559 domain-containing protein [Planctomycetales bacterium]|nr:DUF1559 domain-containing protein [Planctomycetales bacterium]